MFFGNFGNYLSFGDTKFIVCERNVFILNIYLNIYNLYEYILVALFYIYTYIQPRLSKSEFEKLCLLGAANEQQVKEILTNCLDKIYSCGPNERSLAVDGKGTSGYYSPNITSEQIQLVQDLCQELNVSPLNTRLFVKSENPLSLELRLASIEVHEPVVHQYKGIDCI